MLLLQMKSIYCYLQERINKKLHLYGLQTGFHINFFAVFFYSLVSFEVYDIYSKINVAETL